MPNAKLETISRAGHAIMVDNPEDKAKGHFLVENALSYMGRFGEAAEEMKKIQTLCAHYFQEQNK